MFDTNQIDSALFDEDSEATETEANDFIWFTVSEYMPEITYAYDAPTDIFINMEG